MRRQKDLDKNTARGLLFVFIFILSIVPSAFGSMDETKEGEEREEQEKNQLLVLPIVYYTPETKIAGGVGGVYYFRTLEDELRGHPSTFFVDIIYTQKKQFIFEITPDLYLKKGKIHLIGYAGFRNYVENFCGCLLQVLWGTGMSRIS
jgi:hypothetical protein